MRFKELDYHIEQHTRISNLCNFLESLVENSLGYNFSNMRKSHKIVIIVN